MSLLRETFFVILLGMAITGCATHEAANSYLNGDENRIIKGQMPVYFLGVYDPDGRSSYKPWKATIYVDKKSISTLGYGDFSSANFSVGWHKVEVKWEGIGL